MESQLSLQHLHEFQNSHRGSKRNITSTVWAIHKKTRKKQQEANQFIWRERNLHARKLTTMEEFDWHDILNNRRNNKENTVSCDQRDYQTRWEAHSQLCKGVAGPNEDGHQSWWKEHSYQSFLMKCIPQNLGFAFPFAFLAFWSAFLLSARSFLPASQFFLLSGKISGLRPDHQRAIRITISISKKRRKNVICQISIVFEKQQKTKYIIYI